jgi:hypothetical protein
MALLSQEIYFLIDQVSLNKSSLLLKVKRLNTQILQQFTMNNQKEHICNIY